MTTSTHEVIDEDAWERPEWDGRLPLGRRTTPGRPTAGSYASSIYADDYPWLQRWTTYGELLDVARYSSYTNTSVGNQVLEALGSHDRRLYRELLGVAMPGDQIERGRKIHNLLMETLKDLTDAPELSADERPAVHGWYCMLTSSTVSQATSSWARRVSRPPQERDRQRALRSALWAKGLTQPHLWEKSTAPGLRRLTLALDRAFAPLRLPLQNMGTVDGLRRQLDALLPAELAASMYEGTQRLRAYRDMRLEAGVTVVGIDDLGRTELLKRTLEQAAQRIAARESMLVLGPTSSGKSFVGRLMISHAVHVRGRAVVLLPTKALVTQALDEWEDFLAGTTYQAAWRRLPGSRDYPQHDEALLRGEYEIAFMIPEKLGGLMARGMTLSGCGLLVVDELQHIADSQRGPRLEMLMTNVRKTNPEIPFLGLSANLSLESSEHLARWLGIDDHKAILEARHRPVPLDLHVCDDKTSRGLSADGREIDEPNQVGHIRAGWRDNPHLSGLVDRTRGLDRALALAVTLLEEQPEHSVLCFVGGRDAAEHGARAARAALSQQSVFSQPAPDGNPFLGRFSTCTPEEARERYKHLGRLPRTPERDDVVEAIRTGVGFHTARLEASLRTVVEEAFRKQHIRLLFATDTLKLGLNLPADAVIVSSLTTPIGGRRFAVLSREAAVQRLGRAGRLGLSDKGRGYLVAHEAPPPSSTDIDPADELALASHVKANGSHEPIRDQALRALCDVEALRQHYLGHESRGAVIASQLDERWFARLLLLDVMRDAPALTPEGLDDRTRRFYEVSLGAVSGMPAPNPEDVRRLLLEHNLLGPSRQDRSRLSITGLGRAVIASGLEFEDGGDVARIAAAAEDGAGDLTLLHLACRSPYTAVTDWISIPSRNINEGVLAQLRRRLLDFAVLITTPGPSNGFLARHLVLDPDVLGAGEEAHDLCEGLKDPSRFTEPEELTALLRACVLLLWLRGCPLEDIRDFIGKLVSVAKPRGGGPWTGYNIALHVTDIRSLGEAVSYVFNASAELLGVRPASLAFRRLEDLAAAAQLGLPAPLGPLARLQLPGTHRERINQLVKHLDRPFENLADLLGNLSLPSVVPSDKAVAANLRSQSLTREEQQEIRRLLADQDRRARARLGRLATIWGSRQVPGLANVTFSDFAEALREPGPNYVQHLVRVLRAVGILAEELPNDCLLLRSRQDPNVQARLAVRHLTVQTVDLDALSSFDIVVAVSGSTPGLRASFSTRRGPRPPVVVDPGTLLEALVRVVVLEQERAVSSAKADVEAAADEYVTEADTDAWDDFDEFEVSDDGSLGVDQAVAGHEIIGLLCAAPPLLTKTDLDRLVAGLRLGTVDW